MRDVYDFAKFFIKNGADSSPNTVSYTHLPYFVRDFEKTKERNMKNERRNKG